VARSRAWLIGRKKACVEKELEGPRFTFSAVHQTTGNQHHCRPKATRLGNGRHGSTHLGDSRTHARRLENDGVQETRRLAADLQRLKSDR
jgi:hypothetical protein